MKTLLKEIDEGEVTDLTRAYLLRQVQEWVSLKENFILETGMKNSAYFDLLMTTIVPYFLDAYQAYALGLLTELEIRQKMKLSARLFLKDKNPELDTGIKRKRSAKVLMVYLSTIFMAHGIQQELQKIFSKAIDLAKKKSVSPSEIFKKHSLYLEFIRKTETPESFRKKLETLFGALNPKRIIKILNYPYKSSEKYTVIAASQSPFLEEINKAKIKSAETLWKQIFSWPAIINNRILDIFYPRK